MKTLLRIALALVTVLLVSAVAFAQTATPVPNTVVNTTSSVTTIVNGFSWLPTAVFVGLVLSGSGYLLSRVVRSGR